MITEIANEILTLPPPQANILTEEASIQLEPDFHQYVNENEVYRLAENLCSKNESDLSGSIAVSINEKRFIFPKNFFEMVERKEFESNLSELRTRKIQIIKTAEYWARLEKEEIFVNPFGTIEKYKSHVVSTIRSNARQEGWQYDFSHPYVKETLRELTAYFGGFHDQLNKLERDSQGNKVKKKGILLVGGIGLGKTFIMKCFRQNPYQSFIVKSARDLARMIKEGDTENFERLTYKWYKDHSKGSFFGQKRLALMIDDIGTEDNVMTYGNTSNVIADILLVRYENSEMRNSETPNLFMTTNLSLEQLEAKYGSRVWDRMKEMLNIYVLDPNLKSLRK